MKLINRMQEKILKNTTEYMGKQKQLEVVKINPPIINIEINLKFTRTVQKKIKQDWLEIENPIICCFQKENLNIRTLTGESEGLKNVHLDKLSM